MSNQAMGKTSEAVNAIPKSYEEAVRVLADAHAAGPDQVDIYYLPDPERRTVRLIEVSEAFPEGAVERAASTVKQRVVPVFPMGPAGDFPFRSEIIQIKPTEWEQLREGALPLNRDDWGDLNLAQKVPHGDYIPDRASASL